MKKDLGTIVWSQICTPTIFDRIIEVSSKKQLWEVSDGFGLQFSKMIKAISLHKLLSITHFLDCICCMLLVNFYQATVIYWSRLSTSFSHNPLQIKISSASIILCQWIIWVFLCIGLWYQITSHFGWIYRRLWNFIYYCTEIMIVLPYCS